MVTRNFYIISYIAISVFVTATVQAENAFAKKAKTSADSSREVADRLKQDVVELDPCQGTSAGDYGQCFKLKFEVADKELNRVYRELIASLPNVSNTNTLTQKQLREDERKWVRWKQTYCDTYGEENGGAQSWKSSYTVECWATVTEERTLKLKELLKNKNITGSGLSLSHSPC